MVGSTGLEVGVCSLRYDWPLKRGTRVGLAIGNRESELLQESRGLGRDIGELQRREYAILWPLSLI